MARLTRASATAQSEAQAPHSPPANSRLAIQLSSPPPSSRKPSRARVKIEETVPTSPAIAAPLPATPNSNRKRSRGSVLEEEDVNELPHGLGKIPDSYFEANGSDTRQAKKSKRSRTASKRITPKKESGKDPLAKIPDTTPRKAKTTSYGLKPGQTPYPNWPHPTAEECQKVCDLLSSIHGEVKQPDKVPPPSLTVTGCGEVPSVLDSLIRTRLSAATTTNNARLAFTGLVQKFGTTANGVGRGSVDWNKVRTADVKDIFEAIKSGGLADIKSKTIKEILQMVWEENQARRAQLIADGTAPGLANESSEEKAAEIENTDAGILSLEHLRRLPKDEVFSSLIKYPGIGPKTASCVLLFCLQHPSFAVDTHVFRLCKWLGWVPPPGDPAGLPPGAKGTFNGPNERTTFAHCEVRVPDHLKYPLHQLLIKHGKVCPRCRAITGESSEGWEKGCVIDHLVTRTGARKGQKTLINDFKGTSKRRMAKKLKEDESEDESSELSDIDEDDDDDDEFKPS